MAFAHIALSTSSFTGTIYRLLEKRFLIRYGGTEIICPEDISEQAICIDGDIGAVIDELRK